MLIFFKILQLFLICNLANSKVSTNQQKSGGVNVVDISKSSDDPDKDLDYSKGLDYKDNLDTQQSQDEDVEDDILILQQGIQVVPARVMGPQGTILNFTVILSQGVDKQVCWETRSSLVQPHSGDNCISSNTKVFQNSETSVEMFLNSSMYGVFQIRFYEELNGLKTYYDAKNLELAVSRDRVGTNKAIVLFITVLLGVALALMGLDIDLHLVWQALRRPVGPVVGMICQFFFMPLTAYLIGYLILENNYERLGLLLLGCSPGGAASNFWTAMFDGDINLSVTMTFISSVFSFIFTTMWIYLLGSPLVSKTIAIPYLRLIVSLVSFTVPILIGVAVKHWFPKTGKVLREKISRPFFFICLLILPAIGTWNNLHFFYLATWRHLVSGCLLGFGGYIAGAGLAFICRMKRPQIIAISLETAIQNGGIAFIVLSLTFPSPYSDMGVMPILGFFFCSTGPIMMVVYAVYMVVNKLREKSQFSPVAGEEEFEEKTKPV